MVYEAVYPNLYDDVENARAEAAKQKKSQVARAAAAQRPLMDRALTLHRRLIKKNPKRVHLVWELVAHHALGTNSVNIDTGGDSKARLPMVRPSSSCPRIVLLVSGFVLTNSVMKAH